MNKASCEKPYVGCLRRFVLTEPTIFAGIFFTIWMFVFFSVTSLFSRHHDPKNLLNMVVFNAAISGVVGLAFAKLLEKRLEKRQEVIGKTLTKQDKIDLFLWYRHGIKPTSTKLQPYLSKYLEYLETNVRGSNFTSSKTSHISSLMIFGGMFVLQIILFIVNPKHITVGGILTLLLFGGFITITLLRKYGQPNKFLKFSGSRSLSKIARMRQQL